MVNLRRKHKLVQAERRGNQRIELHLPVVILGIKEKAQIIDFSIDGFYIEMDRPWLLDIGRHIHLAIKLPSEKSVIKIRAQVIYSDLNGIGCQFTNQTQRLSGILGKCFDIFNATLPIE